MHLIQHTTSCMNFWNTLTTSLGYKFVVQVHHFCRIVSFPGSDSGLGMRLLYKLGTMASLLSRAEIGRYGRQMILPEWGVEGEIRTTPQLHHAPVICISARDKLTYAVQAARLYNLLVCRSASCSHHFCPDSGGWRTGVSCCPLPCCSWHW